MTVVNLLRMLLLRNKITLMPITEQPLNTNSSLILELNSQILILQLDLVLLKFSIFPINFYLNNLCIQKIKCALLLQPWYFYFSEDFSNETAQNSNFR